MATIENATQIRPFHVDIPDEELADLRRRLAACGAWDTHGSSRKAATGVRRSRM